MLLIPSMMRMLLSILGRVYLHFFGGKHLGIFFFQPLVKVFQKGGQRNQPFYHTQQSLKKDLFYLNSSVGVERNDNGVLIHSTHLILIDES